MVGYGRSGIGADGDTLASGTKRAGQNRFDSDGFPYNPALTTSLIYDFDRLNAPGGLFDIDTCRLLYLITDAGLGPAESFVAAADSGAPAFIGGNVIAGVLSGRDSLGTDINGPNVMDSTFGELGIVTNARMTKDDAALQGVLNPGGGAKYDLVLDMNQQVYGQSSPPGWPGVPDDLTIDIRNVGGLLRIRVDGSDPALNGYYYEAPAANIRSLTIRGSDDDEMFTIVGDLGIAGNVYVDGRGGTNSVIYDYTGATPVPHAYTFSNPGGGYDLRLNLDTGKAIDSLVNIGKHTLLTGAGADTIRVEYMPPTLPHGVWVYANDGNDQIIIGTPAGSMANVNRPLFIDAGTGQDEIWFDDHGSNTPSMAYTIDVSGLTPGWEYALYRTQGVAPNLTFIPNIEYKGAEKITLHTGSQGDLVQIDAAHPVIPPDPLLGTFVKTNGGGDTVYIGELIGNPNPQEPKGLDKVLGPVKAELGGDVNDHLIFEDGGSHIEHTHVYTLWTSPNTTYDYQLYRNPDGQDRPIIEGKGARKYTLNTSKRMNTVNVHSSPATASDGVFINGNVNIDTVTVGRWTPPNPPDPTNGPGLDKINTQVTVVGSGGPPGALTDRLKVDNRGAADKTLVHTNGKVTRGSKIVNYGGVPTVEILTDGGAANVNIKEKPVGVEITGSFAGAGNTATFGADTIAFQVGTWPDRVRLVGDLTQALMGGTLNVSLAPGFTPPIGWQYVLVVNETNAPTGGMFINMPEGTELFLGIYKFRLSYLSQVAGMGTNDVTLTNMPNPLPPPPSPPPPSPPSPPPPPSPPSPPPPPPPPGPAALLDRNGGSDRKWQDLRKDAIPETIEDERVYVDPFVGSSVPKSKSGEFALIGDILELGYGAMVTVTAASLFDIDSDLEVGPA